MTNKACVPLVLVLQHVTTRCLDDGTRAEVHVGHDDRRRLISSSLKKDGCKGAWNS
jgi:hypothetical protein